MRSPMRPHRSNPSGSKKLPEMRKRHVLVRNLEYEKECEKSKRRQLRWRQVRQKAGQAAKAVRERVREEQENQLSRLVSQELASYIGRKEEELAKLEEHYQNALADVGMGHDGVREHEEYLRWRQDRAKHNAKVAELRGRRAMKVIEEDRRLQRKTMENKAMLRSTIAVTEQLRAAEIRAGLHLGRINKVRVIEVDAHSKSKRVRFAKREKFVEDVDEETVERGNVRRIPLKALNENAVEAAIRVQEMEQQEILREEHRSWRRAKERPVSPDYFDRRRSPAISRGDLDTVPVRDSDASCSSPIRDAEVVHRPVTPPPVERRAPIVLGGPRSAFAAPHVAAQPVVRKPGKSSKDETDFIAKVLEDFDFVKEEKIVKVKIDARAASSEVSSISQGRSTSRSVRSGSSEDITQERFLATDWGKEQVDEAGFGRVKGLIEQLASRKAKAQVRDDPLRVYIEKLLDMRRQEIDELSISEVSSLTTTACASESVSRVESSCSVLSPKQDGGKLERKSTLARKRHEGSKDFITSTPSSSSCDSKLSVSKTVRFREEPTAATESNLEHKAKEIHDRTSVSLREIKRFYREQRRQIAVELSKGETRAASEMSLEAHDLSEGMLSSSSSSSAAAAKKASSSNSASSLPSEKEVSSSASASTHMVTAIHRSAKGLTAEEMNDIVNEMKLRWTESVKDRVEREMKLREQKRIKKQQLAEFSPSKFVRSGAGKTGAPLNKSASSGTTTTSSSNATAEFLARLRRMEIPSLKPPSESFYQERKRETQKDGKARQTTSELNTSADLLKVKELDSSQGSAAGRKPRSSPAEEVSKVEEVTPSFSSLNLNDDELDEPTESGDLSHLSISESDSSGDKIAN